MTYRQATQQYTDHLPSPLRIQDTSYIFRSDRGSADGAGSPSIVSLLHAGQAPRSPEYSTTVLQSDMLEVTHSMHSQAGINAPRSVSTSAGYKT